jgi:predicted CxxxxCH...CXXCH cytochrome family protein
MGGTVILKNPDAAAAWSGDKDNYCMACHDGTPAVDKKTTYLNTVHDNSYTNSCAMCHTEHGSTNSKLLIANTNYLVCRTCHDGAPGTNIDVANMAIPGTSGNTHAWDKAAVNGTYQTLTPLTSPMSARLNGSNIVCNTCHDPHNNTNTKYLVNSNTNDEMCKDCHRTRNVGSYPAVGSHPVGVTYTAGGLYQSPAPTWSSTQVGPLSNGKVECSSCHKMHNATTTDGNILRKTNNNALCKTCHLIGATTGTPLGTHNGMSCMDCHDPHGTGTNLYLIKNIIATPNSGNKPVVFTSLTGANSFADGNTDYNGVCEVCHTTNTNNWHYNTAAGTHTHEAGNNCTTCHSHENNFKKPVCHGCHSGAPAAWPTAAEGYTEGAHAIHAGPPYNFPCSTCHFNQGSGGTGEPLHPSGGSAEVVFDPTGLANRFGQDAATPTFNTGTKVCTNIYCHSNGRTAYRGEDAGYPGTPGSMNWSSTTGPQTPTYATVPAWNSGTNVSCGVGVNDGSGTWCHEGPSATEFAAAPNYYITAGVNGADINSNAQYPKTGSHAPNRGAHYSNSQNLSSNGWSQVQCFWCHETDGIATPNPNQKRQGTYGTSFHVDGQTHFKPKWFSNGGTMVNTITYSSEGSAAHCGAGKTCW